MVSTGNTRLKQDNRCACWLHMFSSRHMLVPTDSRCGVELSVFWRKSCFGFTGFSLHTCLLLLLLLCRVEVEYLPGRDSSAHRAQSGAPPPPLRQPTNQPLTQSVTQQHQPWARSIRISRPKRTRSTSSIPAVAAAAAAASIPQLHTLLQTPLFWLHSDYSRCSTWRWFDVLNAFGR